MRMQLAKIFDLDSVMFECGPSKNKCAPPPPDLCNITDHPGCVHNERQYCFAVSVLQFWWPKSLSSDTVRFGEDSVSPLWIQLRFKRVAEYFTAMFRRKAFLHWYFPLKK